MRVLLQPEVFASRYQIELLVLAWLGNEGRHRILPDPKADSVHDAWVAGLDADTRQYWTGMIDASYERERIMPSYWEIAITTAQDAAWSHATPRIPIVMALDFLMQPYRIVLENNVNDKSFLLTLCGNAESNELKTWEQRGWLLFEMGGGAAIVPRVKEIRKSEPLRRQASVLVDSDARRPPDKDKKEKMAHVEGDVASAVRKEAGGANVGVHWKSLQRRAIENYLPLATLDQWMRGNEAGEKMLRAFKRLKNDQKHHYNMKSGFGGDVKHAADAKDLYKGLDPQVKSHLDGGFGKDIANLFQRTVKLDHVDKEAQAEMNTFVTEILQRMR